MCTVRSCRKGLLVIRTLCRRCFDTVFHDTLAEHLPSSMQGQDTTKICRRCQSTMIVSGLGTFRAEELLGQSSLPAVFERSYLQLSMTNVSRLISCEKECRGLSDSLAELQERWEEAEKQKRTVSRVLASCAEDRVDHVLASSPPSGSSRPRELYQRL